MAINANEFEAAGGPTFPELVKVYIGTNPAHRDFRAGLANAKALGLALAERENAALRSVLDRAAFARERTPAPLDYAIGICGSRSTLTTVHAAITLTGNEVALVEAEPGGFVAQSLGLIYREIHRLFETFLIDLFCEIANKDARVLYSGTRSMTHEEIFRAEAAGGVHCAIIERRKSELTHKGFREIRKAFDEIGLPIFDDSPARAETRAGIDALYAIRNIVEHNRSIVDDLFLSAVPTSRWKKGDPAVITSDEIGDALSATEAAADDLNRRAIVKFVL